MVSATSKMSFAVAMAADLTRPYFQEIIEIQETVEELIDYTKRFDSIIEYEAFVRTVRYEHIVLIITSDILVEILTKNIHEIRHVQSIFLFDPQRITDLDYFHQLRQSSYKVCTSLMSEIDDQFCFYWLQMQDVACAADDLYRCLNQWIHQFAS